MAVSSKSLRSSTQDDDDDDEREEGEREEVEMRSVICPNWDLLDWRVTRGKAEVAAAVAVAVAPSRYRNESPSMVPRESERQKNEWMRDQVP